MPPSLPGRNNRRCLCLIVALSLFSLLSMLLQVDTVTAPPPATVVSASELALRACPTPECPVIERVPLGAGVEILEQTSETFARVAYGNVTGFASELYLAKDPGHVPYLIKGEPGCQRVALIFSIGVGYDPATGILDTLERERVPATMFVMGWWAAEHPAILDRMVEEGSLIGSHGNSPRELTGLADSDVADDLAHAAAAIEHATGKPPALLFTPYAAASDERVRAMVADAAISPSSGKSRPRTTARISPIQSGHE